MLKSFVAFIAVVAGFSAVAGTQPLPETVGLGLKIAALESADEMQAFDVYDEITESIFESFRLYHPFECRKFFVRKKRSDGMTYVDKLRRCD
jgi:hypothetical protein